MRILWVSNSPIGPAADILNENYQGSSGGWIQTEYDKIEKTNTEFFFLSTLSSVKKGELLKKSNNKGTLYCLPTPRLQYGIIPKQKVVSQLENIICEINPDIIQIWGTETWLSYAVSLCSESVPKVIFIQGLIGMHQRYLGGYFGNMPEDNSYKSSDSLIANVKSIIRTVQFKKQAKIEEKTLCNCRNAIVDNDFTKAYCNSLSPVINCFEHKLEANKEFFAKRWKLENCIKHTVFTVYGGSAEKGTQNLLKALSIVKKSISDVRLIIPGPYNIKDDGKLADNKQDAFQTVLKNMINSLDLNENVKFAGKLSPKQMSSEMEKANIFVNPSCMEVHALSLREAMTVGVPCISSMCGSVNSYLKNGYNGYIYRYEEYEVLAFYLKRLLENPGIQKEFSENSYNSMRDNSDNSLTLEEIYNELITNNKIGR